jgi:hypothetical protein
MVLPEAAARLTRVVLDRLSWCHVIWKKPRTGYLNDLLGCIVHERRSPRCKGGNVKATV